MNVVARVRIAPPGHSEDEALMVVDDAAYARILAEHPGISFRNLCSVDGVGTYAVAEETLEDGTKKLRIKRVGQEVAVTFAFDSWVNSKGGEMDGSLDGDYLSEGPFHSGTVFKGTLWLLDEENRELLGNMKDGFHPRFVVFSDDRKCKIE